MRDFGGAEAERRSQLWVEGSPESGRIAQVFSVLFVCTGNQCRSPMAEGILKHLLEKRNAPGGAAMAEVSSAGTAMIGDAPATPEAVEVCLDAGVDISRHHSRGLSLEMLARSDLILAMEEYHALTARALLPQVAEKVHLLAEFAGDSSESEIDDPIGRGIEVYRLTFGRIETLLKAALPRILEMAGQAGSGS